MAAQNAFKRRTAKTSLSIASFFFPEKNAFVSYKRDKGAQSSAVPLFLPVSETDHSKSPCNGGIRRGLLQFGSAERLRGDLHPIPPAVLHQPTALCRALGKDYCPHLRFSRYTLNILSAFLRDVKGNPAFSVKTTAIPFALLRHAFLSDLKQVFPLSVDKKERGRISFDTASLALLDFVVPSKLQVSKVDALSLELLILSQLLTNGLSHHSRKLSGVAQIDRLSFRLFLFLDRLNLHL